MDWNTFITDTIGTLVAMLPQMFIMLTTTSYSLGNIKNITATFPKSVDSTKDVLSQSFNEAKEILVNSFNNSVNEMNNMLEKATSEIATKVNGTLTNMQSELNNYREELLSTRNQANMLAKENKLFMDVIAGVLAQDPQKIKAGISTQLISKINMTRDELEKFPETLITDLKMLEKAISEVWLVVGEEKLNAMLDKLGYERKKF